MGKGHSQTPPHRARRLVMPPPEKIEIFELKMARFGAFWELILLQLNCLSYTHKPVSLDFGL